MSGNIASSASRALFALNVQRLALSGIIAAHGIARWWFDAIDPFGEWLGQQGIPAGQAIAYAITAIEMTGALLLAMRRYVFVLCLAYAAIYACGIALVHAAEGWFVVGLGRNGMEYSVLLIVCLLSVAWQHAPQAASRFD